MFPAFSSSSESLAVRFLLAILQLKLVSIESSSVSISSISVLVMVVLVKPISSFRLSI